MALIVSGLLLNTHRNESDCEDHHKSKRKQHDPQPHRHCDKASHKHQNKPGENRRLIFAHSTAGRPPYLFRVSLFRSMTRLHRHMTTANSIPATGQTTHVISQSFVKKLHPRYTAVAVSQ